MSTGTGRITDDAIEIDVVQVATWQRNGPTWNFYFRGARRGVDGGSDPHPLVAAWRVGAASRHAQERGIALSMALHDGTRHPAAPESCGWVGQKRPCAAAV